MHFIAFSTFVKKANLQKIILRSLKKMTSIKAALHQKKIRK